MTTRTAKPQPAKKLIDYGIPALVFIWAIVTIYFGICRFDSPLVVLGGMFYGLLAAILFNYRFRVFDRRDIHLLAAVLAIGIICHITGVFLSL